MKKLKKGYDLFEIENMQDKVNEIVDWINAFENRAKKASKIIAKLERAENKIIRRG